MVLLLSLKVSKGLAEILGTNWKLLETSTKLTLETGSDWLVPLPLALNTPYHFSLTHFEILHGTLTPLALDSPRVTFQADKDLMA